MRVFRSAREDRDILLIPLDEQPFSAYKGARGRGYDFNQEKWLGGKS